MLSSTARLSIRVPRQRFTTRSASHRSGLKSLARLGSIDVGLWWKVGVFTEDEIAGFVLYGDAYWDNLQDDHAFATLFSLKQHSG
jgi:hypothetical protein